MLGLPKTGDKSVTHMPILHRVLSQQRLNCESRINTTAVMEEMRKAVPFEVQVASELYWTGKQNEYSLADDFGSLRLPYPAMWMEWRVPNRIVIDGKEHTNHSRQYLVGCLLHEKRLDDEHLSIHTISIAADANPAFPAAAMPITSSFKVTNDGSYVHPSYVHAYDPQMPKDWAREIGGAAKGNENVAFLALNLINCKNVTTERAGSVNVRRSGYRKRRKEPRIEFHTIVLPGHGGSTAPASQREYQGVLPVHRVRGHFKTFTDDAPLLGQHVGTYWWGWQVRGNKENGMVASDYKVGELR